MADATALGDQLLLFELPARCSVADCSNDVTCKRDQLCGPHYKRKWKYGNPLAGGPMRKSSLPAQPVQDFADGSRACNVCGERKTLDAFPLDTNGTLGRRSHCKPCHSAKSREWHGANRERIAARMRRYRAENPDQVRQQDTERYRRDKDKRVTLATQQSHKRRARLANAPFDPGVTRANLRKQYGDCCFYCQQAMDFGRYTHQWKPGNLATVEHVWPICRGGGHTWDNVVLACLDCNLGKNGRLPTDWKPAST